MTLNDDERRALLEKIKSAGVVGCGGAGFPTHIKLDCRVDTLIINGAECEPCLRTDRWLMRHRADDITEGASLLGAIVGARRTVIALKETYTRERDALKASIERHPSVEIFPLKNYYPAGDEQMIVLDVTGRAVPPAGLPRDAGAAVCNAATALAALDASRGVPFTRKYLTMTGEVARPVIVNAPVGTPFAECLEAAGGATIGDFRVIVGGPMMGKLYTADEARELRVTRTTSGFIAVPPEIPLARHAERPIPAILRQARLACIQCSHCTERCPRHLSGHPLRPHMIMRKLAYGGEIAEMLDDPVILSASLCSECGICEVLACPMGLQPRRVNALVKAELARAKKRWARPDGVLYEPSPERESRRAPSKRLAVRLGVAGYYDFDIDELVTIGG